MFEHTEIYQSHFPVSDLDDVIKCLVLFGQSKTQTYAAYNYINQRKAANPHTGEAGTRHF